MPTVQANETLHQLMTDCEATTSLQLDIMKNKIPLPDMTWSVKDINTKGELKIHRG